MKNIYGDIVLNSKKIIVQLNLINEKLEKYIDKQTNIKRQLIENFVWGISRGLGISVGIVILGTILVLVLKELVTVPIIGSYIAQIVDIVEVYLAQ